MSSNKLSAGDKFPDLAVKKLGGGEFKLGVPQNGATWQMVVVYRGKHCPLCTKYLAKIHGMKEEFLKAGVDIVAVTTAYKVSGCSVAITESGFINFIVFSSNDRRVIRIV